MYRRRRPQRDKIAFSFDSFLDIVANVIGIIVRLILVAWVGARAYSTSMQWVHDAPPVGAVKSLPPPKITDDPLNAEIEKMRANLDRARQELAGRLAGLERVEGDQAKERSKVSLFVSQRQALEAEVKRRQAATSDAGGEASKTLEQLQQRSQKLFEEIKALKALPVARQTVRYRAPVSSIVFADEVHFECQGGRIAFFDLPAFKNEIERGLESKAAELKVTWKVNATTTPVGPFRLRYVIERDRDYMEAMGASRPTNAHQYRYGLSEWTLEPLTSVRGESIDVALAPGSQFRSLVERLDPRVTVVTIWVYPDSFAAFRRLRDYLHERDLEVAGRPLPDGAPIAASRYGTASRGQ